MSAPPDWRNRKSTIKDNSFWRVSGIWPMRVVLPIKPREPQPASLWEFEPSGHVGNMEIRAVDARPADLEFERQKEAFNTIPPFALLEYRGQFIASLNGEIVDSDDNLAALTRRFFREHGDVAVYITKVGAPIRVTLTTPLFR